MSAPRELTSLGTMRWADVPVPALDARLSSVLLENITARLGVVDRNHRYLYANRKKPTPNWPIRLPPALSAATCSRKVLVPERAMVPRFSIISSALMPMPLSPMSSVRLAASGAIEMATPAAGLPDGSSKRPVVAAPGVGVRVG